MSSPTQVLANPFLGAWVLAGSNMWIWNIFGGRKPWRIDFCKWKHGPISWMCLTSVPKSWTQSDACFWCFSSGWSGWQWHLQICALGKPKIWLTYAKGNVGKKHEDCAGGSDENNFRWQRALLAPPPVAKGMRPEATNIDVWRAYAALSSTSGTSRSCHACVFPHFLPCRFCRRRLCRENIFCFAYWCSNHELQKES